MEPAVIFVFSALLSSIAVSLLLITISLRKG